MEGVGDGVRVSVFDDSVENHFKALETISKLCGEPELPFSPDDTEIRRLSSSVTFFREWREFQYKPRTVRFAPENGKAEGRCSATSEVILPQFSSAAVPQLQEEDGPNGPSTSARISKDFVMYVGGSVWALDWCPRDHLKPDHPFKFEFVAVAAHPPESYYHKLGAPLIGSGIVQIWCILHVGNNEDKDKSIEVKKPGGRPKKNVEESSDHGGIKKPRNRPGKNMAKACSDSTECTEEPLAFQFPEGSLKLIELKKPKGRPRKKVGETETSDKKVVKRPRGQPKKKLMNEYLDSSDYIEQPLVVQLPEGPSQLLALEGVPESTEKFSDDMNIRKKRKTSIRAPSGSDSDAAKSFTDVASIQKENIRSSYDLMATQFSQAVALDGTPNSTQECADGKNNKKNRKSFSKAVIASSSADRHRTSNEGSSCMDYEIHRKSGHPVASQSIQDLGVHRPEDSLTLLALEGVSEKAKKILYRKNARNNKKSSSKEVSASNSACKPALVGGFSPMNYQTFRNSEHDVMEGQSIEAVGLHCPEDSSILVALEGVSKNAQECSNAKKGRRNRKSSNKASSESTLEKEHAAKKSASGDDKNKESCPTNVQMLRNPKLDDGAATSKSGLLLLEDVPTKTKECIKLKDEGKKRKASNRVGCASGSDQGISSWSRSKKANQVIHAADVLPIQDESERSLKITNQMPNDSEWDLTVANHAFQEVLLDYDYISCSIPDDVALPRIVLCLAHNGKVVWDLKWRHPGAYESKCHYQMGYLAVLLGNGSLEVWDVPLPHSMKWLYDSSLEEGTDPRFVKLEPVFRCSRLKGGGMQSIPLTVEWSHHDYLLVGCHDGTVALWKFSTTGSSGDTRPLLCFSADTMPIRAVAWAPTESHQQSANIIVTAGHNGLKFWDIRDPFRPLWDLHPAPKFIYSLDWLLDPNCIILAFDDGTLRLLSLVKAAYDAPVYGSPTIRPKQHGLHILKYSSFAAWSVQVSRHTGMVAYCNADGTVSRFQLTRKAVEKQPGRYRAHHFLCGFLSEEESAITVNTPRLVAPVSSKKQVDNVGNDSKLTRSLSKPTQDKAANGGKADGSSLDNQLAVYYGEELGGENESESNLKSSAREEDVDDRVVVWEEGEQEEIVVEKGEAVKKVDTMPAKMVAMHRVRWNMNKGSERWLCSGGAAGIVRCQEVILTDYDRCMARKR